MQEYIPLIFFLGLGVVVCAIWDKVAEINRKVDKIYYRVMSPKDDPLG